jgi:hypothetical protein
MKSEQGTVDEIRYVMGRCNPVPASATADDWHGTTAREIYDRITATAGSEVDGQAVPSRSLRARSARRLMPAGSRARRVVAPIAAALAVVGVIAGATLAASSGISARVPPRASNGDRTPAPLAGRRGSLPVLRTGARFGWLPAGEQLRMGLESTTMTYMDVFEGKVFDWELTTWATGTCAVRGSVTLTKQLICSFGGGVAPARYPVGGRAPSIQGHAAFWLGSSTKHQEIIWEWAPGAWAVFQSPQCCSEAANQQPVATLLRIARAISFAPTGGEPFRFEFQLTDIPSGWQANMVDYWAHHGSLLANEVVLTSRQQPSTQVDIDTAPGGPGGTSQCPGTPAASTKHKVLRGYDVYTTTEPPSDPGWKSDTYQLCAPDVHDIAFYITTSLHAGRTAIQLFEHMRLLWPAADWATSPIG